MNRCKHCGARALPLRATCDYCGTAFPRSSPAGPEKPSQEHSGANARPASPQAGDLEFERLLNHPDLQRFLDEGPTQAVPKRRREGIPKGVIFFMVIAFVILMSGPGTLSPSWLFFLPALIAITRRRSRDRSFPASPLESIPARLMEVSEPWGRAQDPRPRALIELESGQRRFLRLRRDLVGTLKPGDLGAAFVKADVLIDFRRVRF